MNKKIIKILVWFLLMVSIVLLGEKAIYAKTAVPIVATSISHSTSFTYTGKEIKPIVSIKYNGKTLKKGTDYTLSYSNNINTGKGNITITGKGNYTGTITKTFVINKKNISGFDATLSATSHYRYSGEAKKPETTVKWGKKTLRKNVDYTVSYRNNINAGTAKVIIKGKGNYTGTITKTFKINSTNISDTFFYVTLTYNWHGMSIEEFKEKTSDGHFEIKDGKMTAHYLVTSGGGNRDNIYIPKGATNFSSIYLLYLRDVSVEEEMRIGSDYEISRSMVDGNMIITITGKGNYTGTKKIMCIAN